MRLPTECQCQTVPVADVPFGQRGAAEPPGAPLHLQPCPGPSALHPALRPTSVLLTSYSGWSIDPPSVNSQHPVRGHLQLPLDPAPRLRAALGVLPVGAVLHCAMLCCAALCCDGLGLGGMGSDGALRWGGLGWDGLPGWRARDAAEACSLPSSPRRPLLVRVGKTPGRTMQPSAHALRRACPPLHLSVISPCPCPIAAQRARSWDVQVPALWPGPAGGGGTVLGRAGHGVLKHRLLVGAGWSEGGGGGRRQPAVKAGGRGDGIPFSFQVLYICLTTGNLSTQMGWWDRAAWCGFCLLTYMYLAPQPPHPASQPIARNRLLEGLRPPTPSGALDPRPRPYASAFFLSVNTGWCGLRVTPAPSSGSSSCSCSPSRKRRDVLPTRLLCRRTLSLRSAVAVAILPAHVPAHPHVHIAPAPARGLPASRCRRLRRACKCSTLGLAVPAAG